MKFYKLVIALGAAALLYQGSALYDVAHAQQPLKIGIIGPMTGPGAPWGVAAKMSAQILADEVNAKGGLNVGTTKYHVEVVAYDDQYKAAEAVAAYNRLLGDGVKYIMIVTSAPAMAVKQQIEDDKVVTITSAVAAAVIDDKTKYMIRLNSVPQIFLPGYVAWMKANLTERSVVALNPNDETGWAIGKLGAEEFKKNGFDLLSGELYERSTRDFSPLLTKVVALKPQLIDLASSSPSTSGLIVRQARELGFKGRFVQTSGSGWPEIVEAAGKEAAEGLVNVLVADTSNPNYQKLATLYEKAIGQRPNEFIATYYDGFRVMLSAIEKAGDVKDTSKVVASFKDVLPTKSIQGGNISWTPQQMLTTVYVSILQDGKPVIKGTIQ